MTINLYRISADPRALNKMSTAVLINPNPIIIKPTEKINLLRPVFEIDYNDTYLTANYAYCDTFDSFYFVSPPHLNTGNRLEIPCVIDVRQTYSNSILNVPCVIVRAETQPSQIIDSKLPINPSRKAVTSILLPERNNSFGTDKAYSYLLTVVGGEPTINEQGGYYGS